MCWPTNWIQGFTMYGLRSVFSAALNASQFTVMAPLYRKGQLNDTWLLYPSTWQSCLPRIRCQVITKSSYELVQLFSKSHCGLLVPWLGFTHTYTAIIGYPNLKQPPTCERKHCLRLGATQSWNKMFRYFCQWVLVYLLFTLHRHIDYGFLLTL